MLSSQTATPEQKVSAQNVYQTQIARNSVYNEILLTVNNTEHEKQIKQQLKQNESKQREQEAARLEELKKKQRKRK